MALETATHINDLVVTNPLGTDTKAQGDDHLRLIKQVLKTDLPLTTPATATGISLLTIANIADARTFLDVYSIAQTDSAIAAAGSLKSIDYTLAANALTLKLNPTTLSFRSATLTDGAPVSVSNVAQLTTTISSGSTGGTVSAVQSDIVLLAINNAGTMELAWTNLAGGAKLDETNLINTVAEGGAGAADSASTIYSTTARTGVAYKVVGIFRSTQTTAGTWAQAPALVQGIGGQALAALSSFGYGQTWQNVTGSRAIGTTYYNTTGKPITVYVLINAGSTDLNFTLTVGGVAMTSDYVINGRYANNQVVVPPGASYALTHSASAGTTINAWNELR